ncbi:sensor domain-containing protein [uncultured Mycobacterium sp.]|uniref:sensor domain-containing protein n=1 Tax=uncultured Mycobacterium sp. TaxID=171292 RepID=UPI0035C96E4D
MVKTSGTPTARLAADALIVSVDDLRRIAGIDTLAPGPGSEVHQPRHKRSDLPGTCQAVFDQQAAFDGGWAQFDSVTYSADFYNGVGQVQVRGVASVTQAVAVYRDEVTARAAFDRLAPLLTACPSLHLENYDFTVDKSEPATVVLKSNAWEVIYRLKSSVLINVAEVGLPQPEQSARTVVQRIGERIK